MEQNRKNWFTGAVKVNISWGKLVLGRKSSFGGLHLILLSPSVADIQGSL